MRHINLNHFTNSNGNNTITYFQGYLKVQINNTQDSIYNKNFTCIWFRPTSIL